MRGRLGSGDRALPRAYLGARQLALVEPVAGHRLGLGVEGDAIGAHDVQVAVEAVLVPAEGKHRDRNRDADVDADHSALCAAAELARVEAAQSEERGAVCELAGVHLVEALLEVSHPLDAEHRSEDLVDSDPHLGRHVVEDRRAHEVAALVARHDCAAAVEDQLRLLLDARFDPAVDPLAVLGGDHRAELGVGQPGRAHLQILGQVDDGADQLIGDLLLDADGGKRHAALAGAAEGRVDDALRSSFDGRVFQDQRVILGLGQSLDAFAFGRRGLVDVQADLLRAYQRHALDHGVLEERLAFVARSGHQAHDALGESRLDQKLDHAHGRLGDQTRGLQDVGVPRGDGEWEHPAHGDHGWEVERCDAHEDAERLAVADRVVAGGDVHQAAALHGHGERAGQLHHLDRLDHVAARLHQGLAHLCGQQRGQLTHVLLQDGLVPEHHLGAHGDRRVPPGRKGRCCALDGGVHLLETAPGCLGHDLAGAGVGHRHVVAARGLVPGAVHEELELLRLPLAGCDCGAGLGLRSVGTFLHGLISIVWSGLPREPLGAGRRADGYFSRRDQPPRGFSGRRLLTVSRRFGQSTSPFLALL